MNAIEIIGYRFESKTELISDAHRDKLLITQLSDCHIAYRKHVTRYIAFFLGRDQFRTSKIQLLYDCTYCTVPVLLQTFSLTSGS